MMSQSHPAQFHSHPHVTQHQQGHHFASSQYPAQSTTATTPHVQTPTNHHQNANHQQQSQILAQQHPHAPHANHNQTVERSSHHKKRSSSRRTPKTRVFASGYNYNYQFGLSENENHPDMIELEWCRGLNISYICSGLTHAVYLSFTGNYYFCGQIDTEKLGYIDGIDYNNDNNDFKMEKITKSIATPISDFIDHNIRVSRVGDGVSSRHILIISKQFKAYSMGFNQRGQLGLGHFRSTLKFNLISFERSPQDIEDYVDFDVIDVSGGESHSAFVLMPRCTLPIKQILRYWFAVYNLRTNNPTQHLIYEMIFKYIITSSSLLKDPRGRLYVCGCNNFGQLGIGNNSDSSANNSQQCVNRCVRVIGGGLGSASIAQVSCGENHTVCLDNRGRVYCFGDNYYGQSGVHTNHYENVYYPLKIEHFKKQYSARIVKISSGKYHCVALDKSGRVFCWGLGAYGQLGCNKLNKRIVLPIYVEALHETKIIDVRAGMYHTAALANSGKLYCWGSNNYGQCFQKQNQENILTPQQAQIDMIQKDPSLVIYKIFCGYYSTLVLARHVS